MENQLKWEHSPYLLQHKDNPVHWQSWGENAFALARNENKPVFLSIGYSTCHWCHVMAHESFEDEQVAQAINRSFIPIKVDREERPDVDAVYMAACTAMTGSGGWPLTVLLTPDQKPFWAGTYLPKQRLLSLLDQVERLWQEEQDRVLTAGEELTNFLRNEKEHHSSSPKRALVDRAFGQFQQLFDSEWGGFGQAPKFPMAHNLLFLLRYSKLGWSREALYMAETTLETMYRGGLFDHIGGGFSRYSTDRQWLVPHFEKMLYDNALLAFTYAEAFQQTQRPLYAQVTRRTIDYVLRELKTPQGGFYCGQDADSEGVEGKYYVFTPEELTQQLGEAAEPFSRRYGITPKGNFEGKNIPNLIGQANVDQDPVGTTAHLEQLCRYRQKRTHLHKDDKVLTAWNGLMIAALAKAALALDQPTYLEEAARAAAFLQQNLTTPDGRLLARWREGQSGIPGKLEDYAFYAWGLLELYQTTFQLQYLQEAHRLAEVLLERFFDRERGGLYPYASDDEQLITRMKEAHDGALPSGNSVAGLVFSRLARLTGERQWRDAAQLQFSYLAGSSQSYPSGHSFTMLALLEELWPTTELVCCSSSLPQELISFLRQEPRTGWTVLLKTQENQQALSVLAPFTRDYPIPEQGAQYYLCQNGSCHSPVSSISQLELS